MSPVELFEGFRWAYRETFRWKRILRRAVSSGRRFPITLVGNITYRNFVRRIHIAKGFEQPLGAYAERISNAGLEDRGPAGAWVE